MMSSWTTLPGPWRFFGNIPSLLMAWASYVVAAFARYSVSELSALTVSKPSSVRAVAVVVAHAVAGFALGTCAWKVAIARAGAKLAPVLAVQRGARGGLIAAGAACGVLSVLNFFSAAKHQLRLGLLPRPTPLRAFLLSEFVGSLGTGLLYGVGMASVYLLLRGLVELLPYHSWKSLLALFLGLPDDSGAGETGILTVTYLVFLSTAVNFALHSVFTVMMNLFILAPQDFVRLWGANSSSASTARQSSWPLPQSPSAMLLDMLCIGHEAALWAAEKEILKDRKGSMGEWREELELQRCSLALIAMGTSAGTGQRSGWAVVTATWLPIWAQVAKAHALQSIALQAPRDVGIRAALYEVNITQVLRALCLELDSTNLLVQSFRLRENPSAVASALGCEGRGDLGWLAQKMTSTSSAGSSVMGGYYRRALQTVNIGFTLPFRDTLFSWLLALWSSAGRQQEREARPGEEPEKPTLSSARAQSTVWAAQGVSALMSHAPGESRVLLDAMLPVVLGSLAGLLLAVRSCPAQEAAPDARLGGNGGNYARALAERRTLALELEKAVSEVAQKYRGCLEEYSFPPAYAKIINSLCSA
ncbi:unnamed protein product [Ascophyllum nodosum]